MRRARGGDRDLHVVVKCSDGNGVVLRYRKGINDCSHDGVVVDVLDTRKFFNLLLEFVGMKDRRFHDGRRGSFVLREGWDGWKA
jgi:hypothetical protein